MTRIGPGPKKDIQAHFAFMKGLNKELSESGEFVAAEGLGPSGTGQGRASRQGRPPITDGVFPEAKEFLAGYWIVDVDSPERAYEIAARASAGAGPRRSTDEHADRSAAGDERAARRIAVTTRVSWTCTSEHLLRELAPQVLGAVIRRFRDFAAAEDAVQEALIAAATQWPREGIPEQSSRLADSGRLPAHDRSSAQRNGPPASAKPRPPWRWTTGAGAVDAENETDQDDTLILLFMCCHPALTSSSAIALDVAGSRRPDHGRNRQCIPGSRGDHGTADQPRQAKHQGFRRAVPPARPARSGRNGSVPCCTCST